MKELLKTLDDQVSKMWDAQEAPDIEKNLEKTRGTYKMLGPVILYGESETREAVDYTWYLRNLIANDKIDVAAAKTVLKTNWSLKGDKWSRWYKWESVPKFMDTAAQGLDKAQNKEDVLNVVDRVLVYIGKFNFRLDTKIPWLTLSLDLEHRIKG